jgi:NAD+ diphosphatase
MPRAFVPAISPPAGPGRPAFWFLFQGTRLLVARKSDRAEIPSIVTPADLGLAAVRWHYLGHLDGGSESTHCFCGEIAEGVAPPADLSFENLRSLFPLVDETVFWLAGRAVQIVDWDRTHQYCGRCGAPTTNQLQERAKLCPNCGLTNYPRLAPAIIVRVQRQSANGPEILLARARRFPAGLFSVLAGFVEPGETLEECVRREVYEEVGLIVDNIRYFGSQPWPFPHSLMIAFEADCAGGELAVDPGELAEAHWFTANALPNIPPPPSIANRLITSWVASVTPVP